MKLKLITIFILFSLNSFSQNIETLRLKGYLAKMNYKTDSSIYYYNKLLTLKPDDYDAKLALARLYLNQEKYSDALKLFKNIYHSDKTDIEAIKGMADIYLFTDKLDKAIKYYQKAIKYLPDYVPLHFQLAKAYSWNGQLMNAISEYQKIIDIDPTYSEAWQGIGKMKYWQEKPISALRYYRKAMELDPLSEEIAAEYKVILQETKLRLSGTFKILNENEENYNIDALVQQYGIGKRITDHLDVKVSVLLDRSNRNFKNTDIGDTIRTFDNTKFKLGWIFNNNKIYAFSAYSNSDKKLTAYGMKWKWTGNTGKIKYSNLLKAGYDYFYYWNKIGHKAVNNTFTVKYDKISIGFNAGYGIIDSAFVEDVANDKYYTDVNPHNEYSISLAYRLFSLPKVNIAFNYSYATYKFKSRFYYSPLGRKLIGPSINIYFPYRNFYFYSGFSTNFGTEYYYEIEEEALKKYFLDADNWSADIEIGYNFHSLSVSLGAGRFYNNYYSNYNIFFNLKYLF